jgi:hypothetical protein
MESISNVRKAPRLLIMASIAAMIFSGCAVRRLRSDYVGFEGAYADTSNRELLLNLARLNQHDPTYFFKLGQIATTYRMSAGLSGTGSYVPQGTNGTNATGGGTPTILYERDPSFTFVPVNDDTTAQLLLKPIPPEMFYALYQQGWRVDQLFRLMVDRIEYRDPKGAAVEVIHNIASPQNAGDFARFLRVTAFAVHLQKSGYLLLRGETQFVPVVTGLKEAPAEKDIIDAQSKGFIYRQTNGQWELGKQSTVPVFRLNEATAASGSPDDAARQQFQQQIIEEIGKEPDMAELKSGGINGTTALQELIRVLGSGFTIEGEVGSAGAPSGDQAGSCHLVMRSLIGLMSAAAQEQGGFEALMTENPLLIKGDPNSKLRFKDVVPRSEQIPILQLSAYGQSAASDASAIETAEWKDGEGAPPVTLLSYMDKSYAITDKSVPSNPNLKYWNRDVFRLIAQLTSQVTVDISKFPLPETLQLHTN